MLAIRLLFWFLKLAARMDLSRLERPSIRVNASDVTVDVQPASC